jgi:hypothetical protein
MFKGSSCYPISPRKGAVEGALDISANDQMIKILEIIGP